MYRELWKGVIFLKLFALLCCTIGCVVSGIAQRKLDLKEALVLLEEQNPALTQANLNRLLNLQDLKDAKNAFIPQVSVGASHNYNLGLVFDQIAGQLVTGNQWSNTANANINLNATIFQGFARVNAVRIARMQLEAGRLSVAVQKKALTLELLGHYFDALASIEIRRTGEEQARLSSDQLQQARIELELGSKTLVDVSLLESQLANDELRVLTSRNEYDSRILSIKEMLGISLTDSIVLEVPLIDGKLGESDLENSFNNNVELHLAKLEVEQTDLGLKASRNAYYPTLNFSSGYGTNYSSLRRDILTGDFMPFTDQVNQNRSLYLGISLSIPILNNFRVRSDISRARIQLAQRNVELNSVKMQQQKIFLTAKQDYKRSLNEFKVYQQQVISTRTSYEAMRERYQLGVSTAIDLARTMLDYNIAELSLIRSRYALLYHQEVLRILMYY